MSIPIKKVFCVSLDIVNSVKNRVVGSLIFLFKKLGR